MLHGNLKDVSRRAVWDVMKNVQAERMPCTELCLALVSFLPWNMNTHLMTMGLTCVSLHRRTLTHVQLRLLHMHKRLSDSLKIIQSLSNSSVSTESEDDSETIDPTYKAFVPEFYDSKSVDSD